ncbi:MAG: alpha/beta hydrolase [Bdellovibrionales bacterium]|nr:alpha/beta hydrolase [Bdellovibrionales bacterium]
MPYLDNFNYQILGPTSAPKLVFLHGLMGSGANWRRITPAFEKNYQILLLDQRGHGRSFHPQGPYTPEAYADDLNQILMELNWPTIYLVGHSMGGRNALVFADKYPEKVKKLVIEDIGPHLNWEAGERISKMIQSIPTPFLNRLEAKNYFQGPFLDERGQTESAKVLGQYLYANIAESAQGVQDWRFSKAGVLASIEEGRTHERWKELQNLNIPTLIIRGEFSEELKQEVYEKMLTQNKFIQGRVILGCGHWVHSEKPEEFIKILSNFLTS